MKTHDKASLLKVLCSWMKSTTFLRYIFFRLSMNSEWLTHPCQKITLSQCADIIRDPHYILEGLTKSLFQQLSLNSDLFLLSWWKKKNLAVAEHFMHNAATEMEKRTQGAYECLEAAWILPDDLSRNTLSLLFQYCHLKNIWIFFVPLKENRNVFHDSKRKKKKKKKNIYIYY